MAVTLQRLSLQDAHQCLRQCSCLNTCSSSTHASATTSGLVPIFEPALSCLVAVLQGGLLRSRILGISPSRTATICFALPLKEFLEQVTAGLAIQAQLHWCTGWLGSCASQPMSLQWQQHLRHL